MKVLNHAGGAVDLFTATTLNRVRGGNTVSMILWDCRVSGVFQKYHPDFLRVELPCLYTYNS